MMNILNEFKEFALKGKSGRQAGSVECPKSAVCCRPPVPGTGWFSAPALAVTPWEMRGFCAGPRLPKFVKYGTSRAAPTSPHFDKMLLPVVGPAP